MNLCTPEALVRCDLGDRNSVPGGDGARMLERVTAERKSAASVGEAQPPRASAPLTARAGELYKRKDPELARAAGSEHLGGGVRCHKFASLAIPAVGAVPVSQQEGDVLALWARSQPVAVTGRRVWGDIVASQRHPHAFGTPRPSDNAAVDHLQPAYFACSLRYRHRRRDRARHPAPLPPRLL